MDMIKGKLFFFYYLRNKLLDLRSRKNSVIVGAVMSSFPSDGTCRIVSSVLGNEA